jgi:hypothetical protein
VDTVKLEEYIEERYRRTAEAMAAGLSIEAGQEDYPEADQEE